MISAATRRNEIAQGNALGSRLHLIKPRRPEGAAQTWSRPFRAREDLEHRTQGVALGYPSSPPWGSGWAPRLVPGNDWS